RLVAYVVPARETAPSPSELRDSLRGVLPEYMLPSAFMTLEALPVTANGKVDKRALPDPRQAHASAPDRHAAPRDAVERSLAAIWARLLKVERAGIHDNFFELGGDSVLAIEVVAQAAREGLRFTPRDLFRAQTIAELAPRVTTAPAVDAEQGPVLGAAPLTPVQQWFFGLDVAGPHHWNQAVLLELRKDVAAAALARAVRALVDHHDALRLRFRRSADGTWAQEFGPPEGVEVQEIDLSALPADGQRAELEAAATRVQASFDLARGPLVAVARFRLGGGQPDRLLVAVHHLAVDAVSWRFLLSDLELACAQAAAGAPIALPPKTTSFKAWAERAAEFARAETWRRELPYWEAELRAPRSPLPRDFADGANDEGSVGEVAVALDAEETRLLLQRANGAYRTRVDELLLAALAEALVGDGGAATALLVDVEGHGRDAPLEGLDVSRTAGWFTTIYPVRLERPAGAANVIKATKEKLRRVPGRGFGYGLMRYGANRSGWGPPAEVSFNYLGQLDQVLPPDSLFAPAAESAGAMRDGRARRPYVLEVTGSVRGGRFEFQFAYGTSVHDRATIEGWARRYAEALREIVRHCVSPGAGGYTASDFPLAPLDEGELDRLAADGPIADLYPLSPMQQAFWLYGLYATSSGVGVEQTSFVLEGPLNVSAFERAWQAAVDRHAVLRTAFVAPEPAGPLQLVRAAAPVPLERHDWRELAADDRAA
ncbi:MAG TPA: condensation domain-containing protein, partial [Polyangiaceae bacterium]|nr:condensation domain-containing protein [Polyangiaceae bacterium]